MKTVVVKGGSITLRERTDLSVRIKRMLEGELADVVPVIRRLPTDEEGNIDQEKAEAEGLLTKQVVDAFYTATEVAIAARIVSWTFDHAVPKTIADVEELPYDMYEAVSGAAMDGIWEMLADLDFSAQAPTTPGFDETPTEPLGA